MKAVHITTVHQRFDSRIFYKECLSLKEAGYDVSLIVADGKGNQTYMGVEIIDIGKENSRLKRMIVSSKKAVKAAIGINADIYHFHDSELLGKAKILSKKAKVIFDSHEDFPLLMLQRPYIPKLLRPLFHNFAVKIQKRAYKNLSAVVTATDNIRNSFLLYGNKPAVTVKNYPIIDNSTLNTEKNETEKEIKCCYVGGLTQIRGVEQMIVACDKAKVPLILAGPFDDAEFLEKMKLLPGWKNTEYLGVVEHRLLNETVYSKASIGLNMLLKAPNHTDSIPIKQLEYMANGLPVVATNHINFCKEVTKKTDCGILVTPEDTDCCAEAVKYLKDHTEERLQMGRNGKKAVQQEYNWENEAKKLIALYSNLFSKQE